MIIVDQYTNRDASAATVSDTHRVGSSDGVVVCLVYSAGAITLPTVTFNGVSLVNASSKSDSGDGIDISTWIMVNPPVGAYTISVTNSGSTYNLLNCFTLLGVNKRTSNPVANAVSSAASTSTNAPLQIASANSLILDLIWSANGAGTMTPTSGQTPYLTMTESGFPISGGYRYVQPGVQNASYSISSSATSAIVSIALEPDDAPSIWYPNIQSRNQADVINSSGLNSGVIVSPIGSTYGYKPTEYWQNSFLHTVGRVISQPNSPIRMSPTVSASGTTMVSGTFTPPANATILISVGLACSVQQTLSISDTLGGLTWTQVSNTPAKGGTAVFNQSAIFYATAPGSPSAGTVTITSSQTINAGQAEFFYLKGYGVIGATGTTDAATVASVSVTLSGAPAASSLIFTTTQYRVASGAPVITQPPGFTPFALAGTNPEFEQSSYRTGNSPQTISSWTYSPSNTEGAVAIEITTNTSVPTLVAETELETSQIVVDKITQAAQSSASSLTVDHNVTSQDAVLLIFASQMGVSQALNSVNLNGVALTALGNPSVSTLTAGAYFVVNPNVGINTVSSSVTLPTALELIAVSLLGVDKKTLNPVTVANSGASGSPSSTIQVASSNSLLVDFIGSLGTSIAENASQTVYFDQPQLASEAAGSIKLSTIGSQTMSWTTLTAAWVQLVVALEPANALSMWFPAIDMRNLSDVIAVNALDDTVNPVGNFYATYGTYPSTFYQNSFLHTIGRYSQAATVAVTQQPLELQLLGTG